MNFRSYLWTMTGATALAWMAWFLVLIRINPLETGLLGLTLFYLTLFVACMGTLAVSGTLYRIKATHDPLIGREAKTAIRHAILLSTVGILALILSAHELLFWWNLLGLMILVGCIEYFFISLKS